MKSITTTVKLVNQWEGMRFLLNDCVTRAEMHSFNSLQGIRLSPDKYIAFWVERAKGRMMKEKHKWPSLIEHSREIATRLPPTLRTAFISQFQIHHNLHTNSLLPTCTSSMQKHFKAHTLFLAKMISPSIKVATIQLFLCANEWAGAQSTLQRPH